MSERIPVVEAAVNPAAKPKPEVPAQETSSHIPVRALYTPADCEWDTTATCYPEFPYTRGVQATSTAAAVDDAPVRGMATRESNSVTNICCKRTTGLSVAFDLRRRSPRFGQSLAVEKWQGGVAIDSIETCAAVRRIDLTKIQHR